MADEQRPEEVQRWTAKRRAALVACNIRFGSTVIDLTLSGRVLL